MVSTLAALMAAGAMTIYHDVDNTQIRAGCAVYPQGHVLYEVVSMNGHHLAGGIECASNVYQLRQIGPEWAEMLRDGPIVVPQETDPST